MDDLTGRCPCASQRETRAAPGMGLLCHSAGYPSSLIPLRARVSPTTSSLPKSPGAAGRARLPQPRERGISGFPFAIKRESREEAGRRGRGDVPPPLRREVIPRLGSLLGCWELRKRDRQKYALRRERLSRGSPLTTLSARRRRPGWGPGPCTQRGAELRGGEAEPSPAGSPRPACEGGRARRRP